MTASIGAIAAALAAVIGAAITYLAAARRASGRIATTEASQLWQEADKMRQEYRQEIKDLRELVQTLRSENSDLRRRLDKNGIPK